MSSNCTDSSNEQYEIYWFDYFISIGYIDNSDLVNLYAPYGKCTRSLLWITYLINIVHFFLLSSGILYLLARHRNQSGFCWPFITWLSAFIFLVSSIVLFVFLNLNITLFSILIITFQISTLIILWISIFIVVIVTFAIIHRYQRCLLFFVSILLLIQIGCMAAQVLITLHCLFNLKFVSSFLDYAYWSVIIAAAGTIISTLLLDHIFMWSQEGKISARISPAPIIQQNENQNRATSPVDSIILEDFLRQPEAAQHHIYNNNDRTRRFRIQPTNQRLNGVRANVLQLQELGGNANVHSLLTESEG